MSQLFCWWLGQLLMALHPYCRLWGCLRWSRRQDLVQLLDVCASELEVQQLQLCCWRVQQQVQQEVGWEMLMLAQVL